MDTRNERTVYILMVLSTTFWAGAFIAGKYSVTEFPPFTLAFLRFAIASAIIFLIMIKYEENWKIRLRDLPEFVLLGMVGMFGYHVLFFIALKYTSAINSSLIAATNPLITTVLAAAFLGDKLNIKKAGAIMLSLCGVILTVTGGNFSSVAQNGFNIGDLLMIGAVACWAVYSVLSKSTSKKYPPLVITSYSFITCTIALIPFAAFEGPLTIIGNTTYKGWSAVIYMALFPSVIGYLVQQMALRSIGPRRMSIFLNLVPVFSIVLSIIILKEKIGLFKIFSSSLIIAGVYITTKLKS